MLVEAGASKLRVILVVGLALAVVVTAFSFIPVREFSGQNLATVVYDRLTMPPKPKMVKVEVPPVVGELIRILRSPDGSGNSSK